jgi:RNA polymerase sigma-70 factor (ECF subfamily)
VDPLIERARAGDRAAMEALLGQLAPSIHRFGMRLCRNAADADDVLQDALLSVATHLGQYEGRASLTSWAFALTRSACNRRRRGARNAPALGEAHLPEHDPQAPTPEQETDERERAAAVLAALDRLPEDYREVLHLRDVEGLTAPEAAAALEITVDALKSRLHRARTALREALRPLLEPGAPRPERACPDIVAVWSRHAEGDLSPADCAAMEQHLAGCPSCGAACHALREALGACRRSAGEAVAREVRERVRAALAAWAAPGAGAP